MLGRLTSPTELDKAWTIFSWAVATTLWPLISIMRCPTRTPPLSAIPPRIKLQIWTEERRDVQWNGKGAILAGRVRNNRKVFFFFLAITLQKLSTSLGWWIQSSAIYTHLYHLHPPAFGRWTRRGQKLLNIRKLRWSQRARPTQRQ